MAPRPKVDLIYIHFTYVPTKETEKLTQIYMQYENQQLSDFLVTYRYWLDQITHYEKSKLTVTADMRFTEWRINSNNADLFTIYGKRFEKVLLVLGEDFVYWTFYFNGIPTKKRVQGKGRIPLTYCACCIHQQYTDILSTVKNYVTNKYKMRK